ncbi:type II toxin-antitoxin system VapC family toxin [Sphaerospermopsis aphanizomenoides BCCUSP55]|uniref:type II toxin-antitoxin system VapC family toxin n=1 Tax=Sphaerospermopsis aphanizomenoides TaxID=459663 RepID=UPI0019068864|nr:type II toxin-antitoxin system VapC family toxin [Sphaerospermopsis aphanizomenoides]MBK1987571.1 type II toxin-antitoxin system VapC family toxin [Sphaerospermopsis aphanizomenoides BCCUSP55]
MAKLYILDTDHVSLFQNGNPRVAQRISQKKPENLAVTVITFEEKIKGWLNEINKSNNEPFKPNSKLIWGYKGLIDEIEFFKNIQLLAFDNDAYETYQLLVFQKLKRIGARDLRIAAITKSVKGILVTRNWKDFENVPGLLLEDWTI